VDQEQIILFSSDATLLYKGDVFRSLALPDCHSIQFRYTNQWVLPEILENPAAIRGRTGVIVFVAGNNQTSRWRRQRLSFHPIRICSIREAIFESDIEQFIAIIELCQFAQFNVQPTIGPPDMFLTKGLVTDYQPSTWLECVHRLERFYPQTLFYRVNRVLCGQDAVVPKYSNDTRTSFFQLDEETDYSLECLYYDPTGGDSPLWMTSHSEDIDFSNTFESGAGAMRDKRLIQLKTRLLTSRSAGAFITFHSTSGWTQSAAINDPNHVQITFHVRRRSWKTIYIGLFIALATCGLGLAQTGARSQAGQFFSITDWIIRVVGVMLISVSGALLYRFFNKT